MDSQVTHPRATNLGDVERALLVIGGGLLTVYGVTRRSAAGYAMASVGATMAFKGVSGHSNILDSLGAIPEDRNTPIWNRHFKVVKSITINRPRHEMYAFIRDFENLPLFMKHLKRVRRLDDTRSEWTTEAPGDTEVSWVAQIEEEQQDELIRWRTEPESDVEHTGLIRFKDAPKDRGTELWVELEYQPPAGALGAVVATLFGDNPEQQITDDLRRLKAHLEAGEIPTIKDQPSGNRGRTPIGTAVVEMFERHTSAKSA